MKNSKLFFVLTILALMVAGNANAKPAKFLCTGPDLHSLEINVDDQYLNNSMKAPDFADVSFVFDSQHFDWKAVQYISLSTVDGQVITEFRQDGVNKLYIQLAASGPSALATVEIEKVQTDFDCTKYGKPTGK